MKYKDDLSLNNDLILFRNRVVIPEALHKHYLKILHRNHDGNHLMKSEAKKFLFWINLETDIENITKLCDKCFTNNAPKGIKISSWVNQNFLGKEFILITVVL